jgi:hypothetical protein
MYSYKKYTLEFPLQGLHCLEAGRENKMQHVAVIVQVTRSLPSA